MRPRRRRHLTLVTMPVPEADVVVVSVACCMAVVVLHDGQVQSVFHEDDHAPDDAGIDRELARHRQENPMPEAHEWSREATRKARSERAQSDQRSQQIAEAHVALMKAWTPTEEPSDPKDIA